MNSSYYETIYYIVTKVFNYNNFYLFIIILKDLAI